VPAVMAAIYGLSTPLGIVIGIGLNGSWNDNSSSTLVTIGVLESIAAGILIYDSLVNIIGPHMQSPAFRAQSAGLRAAQLLAFWLGAGIMAFIGKYA